MRSIKQKNCSRGTMALNERCVRGAGIVLYQNIMLDLLIGLLVNVLTVAIYCIHIPLNQKVGGLNES